MCVFNKHFFPPLQSTDPIVLKYISWSQHQMLNQQLPVDGSCISSRILDLFWIGYLLPYTWYCDSDYAMGWTVEEIEFNFCQAQEIFLFLQSIQASSGAHPISYSVGIRIEAAGFI